MSCDGPVTEVKAFVRGNRILEMDCHEYVTDCHSLERLVTPREALKRGIKILLILTADEIVVKREKQSN